MTNEETTNEETTTTEEETHECANCGEALEEYDLHRTDGMCTLCVLDS